MSTGDRKVDIFLKKFLPQQQITENFFDYLEKAIRENFKRVYPASGIFAPNILLTDILSSSSPDTFSITTPLEAADGPQGNQIVLDPSDALNVPFENVLGIAYHVGLRHNLIPRETEVNVRTGVIKYTFKEEAVGDLAEPDAVADDGDETLTITVDAVCESGVSHAGRKVIVWLKQALTQAQAFEEATVIWDGVNNKIETTTALGQVLGSISTDPSAYQIFLKGPTVRRNTDLRLDANIAFLGIVTGAGSGNAPTVFDETDVQNNSYSLPALADLFFAEHDFLDGTHTDITPEHITTDQTIPGIQFDTMVNASDEDSPDAPVAHTLFESAGGSGLQNIKWRIRNSSGVTIAFLDAHGNAYFQNLAAVDSIFTSNLIVEGNQSIKGSTTLGDDILNDTVTFNAVLQSLTDMLYVIDSNNDGTGHAHRFYNHTKSGLNEIFRIEESGLLRLFGNIETIHPGLNIDLDVGNLTTGEVFQITRDGGLATLFQVLEQGNVKLFGPKVFTDNASLTFDLDADDDQMGELFEVTKNGGAVTLFQILEDAALLLFGPGLRTNAPVLSIDLDTDNDDTGEIFRITKDGGISSLFEILEQGNVRLFGPKIFTDHATLAIDLDGDNSETGELFEVTKDGSLTTLFQVLSNAGLKLFGPGLLTDQATLSIDLDSNADNTGEVFQITKDAGLATLLQVLEQGNIKLFGPKLITDNATLAIDLDGNADDTGELFEITKDGGAFTLFQVLENASLMLFGPGLGTKNPIFSLDLDSDNDETGEIFQLTKNGGLATLFQILEQGNVKLFGSKLFTDNATLAIDLDSDASSTGELFEITKNGGTVTLLQLLENAGLLLFGPGLATNNPTLSIDLDTNANETGETFSITKHAGLVTLLQILEQGDLKLFGTNILTDGSLLNIDLDSDNNAAGEMLQVSKNGGGIILFQLRDDGSIKVFGPKIFTDNAILTIDLDSDASQSGEKLVITKDGSTQLAEVNEFGDVKAARDQISGGGNVYQNAAASPINVPASLNAVYDETLFRRLLKAIPNNPASALVHIGPSRITASDGSDFVLPLGSLVSAYAGGTINFSTGVITGGGNNFTPTNFSGQAGQWSKYSVSLLPGNTLLVLGSSTFGSSKALAPNPILPSGAIATVVVAVQDNGTGGIGTINAITEANFDRLPAAGGGASSGDGEGGAAVSPASGFKVAFSDHFTVASDDTDSKIDDAVTNAQYSLLDQIYNLKCDKTKTASTIGTSFTLSSAPSFVIQPGDIIYHAASGVFRRIAALSNQMNGTLDAAFPTNLTSASVLISQAVWTKDLVNDTGDATQKTRPRDFFPGEDIHQVNIDYFDSLTASDSVPDFVDDARIVVSGSNSGLQADTGLPLSSTFTEIFVRPNAPNQIENYPLATYLFIERLFLVFFCSPSNPSVTTQANLIEYKVSFYERDVTSNGGVLDAAFCFSDGSGVEVNCQTPFLSGGKTHVKLNFNFVPAINPGTTSGDLEVIVDGKVLPRFVSGSTLDAYWKEVATSTDEIEFHADLSVETVSIEIRRRQGSIDTSDQNRVDINSLTQDVDDLSLDVDALTLSLNALSLATGPVGTIIPYMPGYFTGAGNSGFTLVGPGSNTVAAVNAFLPANYRVCDGTALNDAGSPIFNGVGRFLPDLTDERFLHGNVSAGGTGGSNSITPAGSVSSSFTGTAAARSGWFSGSNYSPTGSIGGSQNIDHQHNIAHVHQWLYHQGNGLTEYTLTSIDDSETVIDSGNSFIAVHAGRASGSFNAAVFNQVESNCYTTGALSPPTGANGSAASSGSMNANTTVSGSNFSFSGSAINIASTFAAAGNYTPAGSVSSSFSGSSFENRPKYLNCFYIMRVK